MSILNDPTFVSQLIKGDSVAFEKLYNVMAVKLSAYLSRRFRLSYQDAEELAQDTLLQVHERITSFDPFRKGKLTSWIFKIAIRKTLNQIRRGCRPDKTFLDDHYYVNQGFMSAPYEDEGYKEEYSHAAYNYESFSAKPELRAFNVLGETEKDILRMRLLCKMSFSQIAEIEGIKVGTARTRFHRAVKRVIDRYIKESCKANERYRSY